MPPDRGGDLAALGRTCLPRWVWSDRGCAAVSVRHFPLAVLAPIDLSCPHGVGTRHPVDRSHYVFEARGICHVPQDLPPPSVRTRMTCSSRSCRRDEQTGHRAPLDRWRSSNAPTTVTGSFLDQIARRRDASPLCSSTSASLRTVFTQATNSSCSLIARCFTTSTSLARGLQSPGADAAQRRTRFRTRSVPAKSAAGRRANGARGWSPWSDCSARIRCEWGLPLCVGMRRW